MCFQRIDITYVVRVTSRGEISEGIHTEITESQSTLPVVAGTRVVAVFFVLVQTKVCWTNDYCL